jgi:hypothetical protein
MAGSLNVAPKSSISAIRPGSAVPKAAGLDWFRFALALGYLTAASAYIVWHHGFFSPDQFFVLALLVALSLGRFKAFLWDWMPLVALLLGYEYVRGLVPLINANAHTELMIWFDQRVFGNLPTLTLQNRFYCPGEPRWYDYASVVLYLLHFVVPLLVAFIFWLRNREVFKQYAAGMVILSYLAYLTYLAYPTVPPWMASQGGLLPYIVKILDVTFASFGQPIYLPTVYRHLGVNMVAAVPSLHAAYPLLTGLFVARESRKLIPLMAIYVISGWVAVVYLGEHYVFDVLAGAVYALFTYGLLKFWPYWKRR